MSKKSLNPLEHPPTASSSDEEEVETSSGEEEEDSSSEEDEPKAPSSTITTAAPSKSAVKQASESESGSETETDSDSESEKPSNPPPNHGSGKSIAVSAPSASSAVKPKKKEAEPVVKSGTKRPSEGTSKEPNSKRAKEDDKKIGEDTKKPAFQRLWSEEDEITVLQGMINFKNDTGKSPYEDTNGYYDFIKKSISFEVSKNQFMDKIRSLKKKYMGKEKPTFTKPHDQKSYKLCKYIWGPEGMALESSIKSNGVAKKTQKSKKLDSVKQELVFEEDKKVMIHGGDSDSLKKSDWFENSFLVKSIAGFGIDEYSVKQGWRLVGEENKKKVEDELKKLQDKEMEFVLQKTKILQEVASLITEASK